MNGPGHYAEAERLLQLGDGPVARTLVVAEAQVHAMLALVAATALPGSETMPTRRNAWREVIDAKLMSKVDAEGGDGRD